MRPMRTLPGRARAAAPRVGPTSLHAAVANFPERKRVWTGCVFVGLHFFACVYTHIIKPKSACREPDPSLSGLDSVPIYKTGTRWFLTPWVSSRTASCGGNAFPPQEALGAGRERSKRHPTLFELWVRGELSGKAWDYDHASAKHWQDIVGTEPWPGAFTQVCQ